MLLLMLGFLLAGTGISHAQTPGGIANTSVKVWLRADNQSGVFSDAGTTQAADGATVQQWNDFSGNSYNLSQSTAANRPTYYKTTLAKLVNFNPTINFTTHSLRNANPYITSSSTPFTLSAVLVDEATAGYNNFFDINSIAVDYFTVYKGRNLSPSGWLYYAAGAYTIQSLGNAYSPAGGSNAYYDGGTSYVGDSATTQLIRPQSFLFTSTGGSGWPATSTFNSNVDGNAGSSFSGRLYSELGATKYLHQRVSIGAEWADLEHFGGRIPEVIIFDKVLTADEANRLSTYYAVKYGTTLGSYGATNVNTDANSVNYLSSGGTTVWNTATNAGYNSFIFGIARDDTSSFQQRISKSTLTGDIVTISTDSNFTNPNQTGAGGHTDVSTNNYYLMAGNNNAATTYATYAGGRAKEIMNRKWKVQETGGDQGNVYVKTSDATAVYLVVSNTSTFSDSSTWLPLTAGVASVNLADGQYFTYAKGIGIAVTAPSAEAGVSYTGSVVGQGGTAPYTYTASGLPAGLSINSSTGAITGTPTTDGTYPVTYTVTDALGQTSEITQNLIISADTDGDGIDNATDLDDDNDGILDANEMMACANVLITPSTATASHQFGGAGGNETINETVTPTTTFGTAPYGTNAATTGNSWYGAEPNTTGNVIYTFATPVNIDRVYLWNPDAYPYAGNDQGIKDFTVKVTYVGGSVETFGPYTASLSHAAQVFTFPHAAANVSTVTLQVTDTWYGSDAATAVAASTVSPINGLYNFSLREFRVGCAATDIDTDGDGTPDRLDRDSDGDGCFDAIEGGASFTTANIDAGGELTGTVSTSGVPTVAGAGQTLGTSANAALTDTACPCNAQNTYDHCDRDGDGVVNSADLDDDNDGILDATEENCSTAANWTDWTSVTANASASGTLATSSGNVEVTYTSGEVISINGVTWFNNGDVYGGTMANSGSGIEALRSDNGVALTHIFTFSQPVTNPVLAFWSFDRNTVYTFNQPFQLLGKTPGAVVTGNTQFMGPTTTQENIGIQFRGTFTSISYTTSLSEVWTGVTVGAPVCNNLDTDGDGIANRLDIDSDADGCFDAVEGGASFTTANTDASGELTGTVSTSGVPTVAGSGQSAGVSQSGSLNACADTDGDGLGDLDDLDDDNDGILDVTETQSSVTSVFSRDYEIRKYALAGTTVTTRKNEVETYIVPSGQLVMTADYRDGDNTVSPSFGSTNFAGLSESTGEVFHNGYSTEPNNNITDFIYEVPSDAEFQTYTLRFLGSVDGGMAAFVNGELVLAPGNGDDNANFGSTITGVRSYTFTASPGDVVVIRGYNITATGQSMNFSLEKTATYSALDTDADGIANHLDLDSDADGCFDAIEGGASFTTANIDASGELTGTVSTSGVPTVAGSGQSAGTSMIASLNACADTDGDGIGDLDDLDDDNDGILDAAEEVCPTVANWTDWTSANSTTNIATGALNTSNGPVTVTYTSPNLVDIQTPGLNNLGDAYAGTVDFAAPSEEALRTTHGVSLTHTYTFSQAVTNPILLFWSMNGNTFTFTTPFTLLGQQGGVTVSGNQLIGAAGESNAAIQFIGTFSSISYTSSILESWTGVTVGVKPCTATDSDGDGIPNRIETDSDGDGCFDAIEGGASFTLANIDASGELTGTVSTSGVPTVAGAGQTIGTSQNSTLMDTICTIDTDGDGTPDVTDPDDDGDGIPDTTEGTGDTDGDGVPDRLDLDSDNDGIRDSVELANALNGGDTDGDGIPDYKDLDSDNDGINDVREAGGTDANGDGKLDGTVGANGMVGTGLTPPDTDGDGNPNYVDLDSDGDSVPDLWENGGQVADTNGDGLLSTADTGVTDADGDGIMSPVDGTPTTWGDFSDPAPVNTDGTGGPNYLDTDSDGDGLTDLVEAGRNPATLDTNGDGIVDSTADADNDGLADPVDTNDAAFGGATPTSSPTDADGDGVPDITDADDDGDGILDTVEIANALNGGDTDGDGIPDHKDLDSDNDGINDVLEAGGTDVNGDGKLDGTVGTNGVVGTGLTPPDTDGDGNPNYIDLDSDGDSVPDLWENGGQVADTNGDGLLSTADTGVTDADGDGIMSPVDGTPTTWGDFSDPAPVNTDGTGGPNYLDTDSDGDGLTDLVEAGRNPATLDTNGDGIVDSTADADNDGLADPVDTNDAAFGGATPTSSPTDADGDGVPDITDADDDGDGILDTVEIANALNGGDTDGDGIPDHKDLDSDNDGINDVLEAGGTDVNGDGKLDGTVGTNGVVGTGLTPPDTDGDGNPNYIDLDSDGDSVPDLWENGGQVADTNGDGLLSTADTGVTDADGDGIMSPVDGAPTTWGDSGDLAPVNTDGTGGPNYLDTDSDGDGVTDLVEAGRNPATLDTNGDGIVDSTADADNDGLADPVDTNDAAFGGATPIDTDGDGVPDITDADDDGDGILDTVEIANALNGGDTDGDGIPDHKDLDSDNDGINDVLEAGGTDANGDGKLDGTVGTNGVVGTGLTPPDTDGDGNPNYIDLDSDGDSVPDLWENGGQAADTNGDGLLSTADTGATDADGDGIMSPVDGAPTTWGDNGDLAPVNTDGTGGPNYLDTDSDGDGLTDLVEAGRNPATLDTNGDGIVDSTADADNDGLADPVDTNDAAFGGATPIDTDGDGVPDITDADDDGDGILDTVEIANALNGGDTDGDGIPDHKDLDSDNDGINDVREAGGTDANGDGKLDGTVGTNGVVGTGLTPPDTDGDGRPNYLDLDSDNDTQPDVIESGNGLLDTDMDGTISPAESGDTDGDGIPNALDGSTSFGDAGDPAPTEGDDADTIPNYIDPISDNSGVTDMISAGVNPLTFDTNLDGVIDGPITDADQDGIPETSGGGGDTDPTVFGGAGYSGLASTGDNDNDGVPDELDLDDDNDGIPDTTEDANAALNGGDTDGDGVGDSFDLDSDGDGIPDVVEAGHSALDANNDGLVDGPTGQNGLANAVEDNDTLNAVINYTPRDTDGDSAPDYLDLDSDNDGISDVREAGGTDANGDGERDGTVGTNGLVGTGLIPTDTDADGIPNYKDLDSDNDSVPDLWENGGKTADTNGDGILTTADTGVTDADGDGIMSPVDGAPTTWGDLSDPAPVNSDGTGGPNYLDTDSDGDGTTDLVEAGRDPATLDPDGDGVIESPLNTDADGDGLVDPVDTNDAAFGGATPTNTLDTDGDGIPDVTDPDDDGDGIPDTTEGTGDTDGDGVPDRLDVDSDGDGIPDSVELANALNSGDTDGDGIPDYKDLDSDNDGINDVREAGGTDANGDGKLDGTVGTNGMVGTGITAPTDSDSDGRPNYLDLDSDNDSIPDLWENGGQASDTNGDGTLNSADGGAVNDPDGDGIMSPVDGSLTWGDTSDPAPVNPDGDGLPSYIDADSDNDGITDLVEAGRNPGLIDPDGDGKIEAPQSADNDGDGLADPVDTNDTMFGGAVPIDTDGDGIPNNIDTDDDNDGIPDTTEGTADTDGDGIPDSLDRDSDNDGIMDIVEKGTTSTPLDSDNDGIPDYKDLDSDNDGINDVREAGGTDANGDGRIDGADIDQDGVIDTVDTAFGAVTSGSPLLDTDTDGDGVPNRRDVDSDNDSVPDLWENGGQAADTNGDGLLSTADTGATDIDGDGIMSPVDGTTAWGDSGDSAPLNTDGTGGPNYLDTDSDGDGTTDLVEAGRNPATLDPDGDGVIESPQNTDADGDGLADPVDTITGPGGAIPLSTPLDTDGDGVPDATDTDDDNDGILDTVEDAAGPDTDGDGIPNRLDLDSDNDGINDVREAGGTDANGDGKLDSGGPLTPTDTDGDGKANPYDLDSDNDSVPDLWENGGQVADTNGDGTLSFADTGVTDADGDGIMSPVDGTPTTWGDFSDPAPVNSDGTGGPNYLDTDSDGDGLTDLVEAGRNPATLDPDGDGVIESPQNTDADGDGLADPVDTNDAAFGGAQPPATGFAAWQATTPGTGTLPASNNDFDRLTDLMEYAFSSNPATGVPVVLGTGNAVISGTDAGPQAVCTPTGVDVQFRRIAGSRSDVTYTLQTSTDLVYWSNAGAPTITNNGDGTETVKWTGIGSLGSTGFARVQLVLASPSTTQESFVVGWQSTNVQGKNQTLSHNLIKKPTFSSTLDSASGSTLTPYVLDSMDLRTFMSSTKSYYVEITSGPAEGHRFDVNYAASTATTIALNLASVNNTASALPSGMAGSTFLLREHVTLADLAAPKSSFTGSTTASSADQVQLYGPAGFATYYLLDARASNPSYYYWALPGGIANRDALIIAPGTGAMINHLTSGSTSMVCHVGEVRANDFRTRLPVGTSLTSSGYPLDDSPNSRAHTIANGFIGSNAASTADQLQLWAGDTVINAAGYNTYWLLNGGTAASQFWRPTSGFINSNATTFLKAGRAQFLRRYNAAAPLDLLIPQPWTP